MKISEIVNEGWKSAAVGGAIGAGLGAMSGDPNATIAGGMVGTAVGNLPQYFADKFREANRRFKEMNKLPKNSRELAERFASLGNMKGMTLSEVVSKVGVSPNSMAQVGPGQVLYQWMTIGSNLWTLKGNAYHLGILFKDGKVESVTHETLLEKQVEEDATPESIAQINKLTRKR